VEYATNGHDNVDKDVRRVLPNLVEVRDGGYHVENRQEGEHDDDADCHKADTEGGPEEKEEKVKESAMSKGGGVRAKREEGPSVMGAEGFLQAIRPQNSTQHSLYGALYPRERKHLFDRKVHHRIILLSRVGSTRGCGRG